MPVRAERGKRYRSVVAPAATEADSTCGNGASISGRARSPQAARWRTLSPQPLCDHSSSLASPESQPRSITLSAVTESASQPARGQRAVTALYTISGDSGGAPSLHRALSAHSRRQQFISKVSGLVSCHFRQAGARLRQ